MKTTKRNPAAIKPPPRKPRPRPRPAWAPVPTHCGKCGAVYALSGHMPGCLLFVGSAPPTGERGVTGFDGTYGPQDAPPEPNA